MGEWRCYKYSGLVVRSQFELAPWREFACECPAHADVTILARDAKLAPAGDGAAPHWNGETLSFTVDQAGRWSISAGTTIDISMFAGADDTAVQSFTLGSAWAALGYQRRWAMLHSSCVEINGRAVLFCGHQEQGKSTMAGGLVARGHTLLVDDLVRVEPGEKGSLPMAHPGASRLKLWRDAIDHFGVADNIVAQDDFRDQKFHLAVTRGAPPGPAPLAGIVLLDWAEAISIEKIAGAEAVRNVLEASTYRPELLAAMELDRVNAGQIARILAQAPVYRLARPRDLGLLETVCDKVERLFGTTQAN